MGFVATPKARSARSLASACTPASRHPMQNKTGMQLREFLERRRWQEILVVEEGVSGSRRRPERDRLLDADSAARDKTISRERNLPISGPAGSLRVIFHAGAAQTPKPLRG